MAAQAGGDVRAGIGTRLKAAREKKGLTILQAAEKMHVDPRLLESLEAENFTVLGAPVYVKGHMRHYAELVGEQAAELQELYAHSTRAVPVQPDLTRISRAQPESESAKLTGPAIVVLVAIAAIGSLWWLLSTPSEKPLPTPVQDSAQSGTAGQPEATGSGEGVSGAEAAAKASVGSQPSVAQGTRRNTAAVATPTVARATPMSTAVTSSPAVPPAPRKKEGELTLKFSADSWAEVYDASGQRLFYDVGAASSAHTVKGLAPMRVILGNASGVALEYNGRPTPIPGAAKPDGSVHFVINAHGRAVPAAEGN